MWTSSAVRVGLLEAEWRRPTPRFRNYPLIARYHQTVRAEPAYHRLDDVTWQDLNGEEMFGLLDGTASRVGQQCLYHRLRSPLNDAGALQEFDAAATLFAQQPTERGQALLALNHLAPVESYYLADLVAGADLPPLPWAAAAPASVMLLLATVVGGFWQPALWLGSVLLFLVHTLLYFWYRGRILAGVRPMLQLGSLHRAGRALLKINTPITALQNLAGSLKKVGSVVGKVSFLLIEDQLQSNATILLLLLLQYVKILLLLDFIVYYNCRREVVENTDSIRRVFEAVGYVDSALAVAGFRQRHAHCTPRFTDAGLQLTAAYNPLVPGCVPNDLAIAGAGVLLTGSNMSGKTTFMRTIGLNALLAQTIATCPAAAYEAPFRKVMSSVNLADSLPEGKSYYFAEAEAVLRFVQAAEADRGSYLFVLDELFKGTNTVERIAATRAVLAYLQSRSLVVASTHDGELGELLRPNFSEYHFSETVTDTDWYFDYLLKPGPLTTRNAIRLLARVGFPDAIVQDALALSSTLDAGGTAVTPAGS